jgi:peptidyl-prolyl cis-trans isomerase C
MVRLGLLCVLVLACGRGASPGAKAAPPAAPQAVNVNEDEVVARVDGQPITRADLERRLADRAPFVRARYATPEKRKELLDSVVRFEVLAREAESRGYARDPDVIRVQKQRAIDRMIAEEIDKKLRPEAIPREELERIYQQHPEEFTQQEAVRFDQILVRDPAKAKHVAALARALGPRDEQGFRRLVATYSEDEDSKSRAGDSTFLERDSKDAPLVVVEAAFAAFSTPSQAQGAPGRILGPLESERGHHILRLTQRRERFLRPFETVEPLLRTRAVEQRRRQEVEAWIAEARRRAKVEIYQDRLDKPGQNPPQKPLVEGQKP